MRVFSKKVLAGGRGRGVRLCVRIRCHVCTYLPSPEHVVGWVRALRLWIRVWAC